MVTKSERMPNILYMKLQEKTYTLLHFDTNVNRDGIKEEKVMKTVVPTKY